MSRKKTKNPVHRKVFEDAGYDLEGKEVDFDSGHRKYPVEQIEKFIKKMEQFCWK